MADTAPRPQGRDRRATEKGIVDAAMALVAGEGFAGLGINAVARRAGCDKQLIYRYFGGLDGLVEAIGAGLATWVSERLAPIAALPPPASYRELVERFVLGYLHALRGDPLMQKIVAWEVAAPSPEVQRVADARSKAMRAWVAAIRGDFVPPIGVDVPAMNAILLAAVHHLVLAGAASGRFAGQSLRTEADWDRIRTALSQIIRAMVADASRQDTRAARPPTPRRGR